VSSELQAGLVLGIVMAAASAGFAVLAARSRRGVRRPFPFAGIGIAVAALLALSDRRDVPASFLLGMLAIVILCELPPERVPPVVAAVVAVPCAAVAMSDLDGIPRWATFAAVLVASVGAVAAARTDDLWRDRPIGLALFAISALAVYLAVPDTEEVLVLVGAAVPAVALGWPLNLASLGRGGAGATVVLLAWSTAIGGRAEPPSIVGALGTVGLLAGLSAGYLVASTVRSRITPAGAAVVVVVLVHAALALVAARVGAVRSSAEAAVVITALVLAASTLVGAVVAPPSPPPPGSWSSGRW
jgi:hypothetical protein